MGPIHSLGRSPPEPLLRKLLVYTYQMQIISKKERRKSLKTTRNGVTKE